MTIDLRKTIDYLKRLSVWRRAGLILGLISLAIVFIGAFVGFARWRGTISNSPEPTLVVSEVSESTPTITPSALPTPIPSPTPELRKTAYVVWANQGLGVYLRDQPGGLAVDVIPNGTVLTEVDQEVHIAKGIDWVQVSYNSRTGWVARHLVYLMDGMFFLVGNEGTWLYEDTAGKIDIRLQPGTPYQIIEVDKVTDWFEVRLANGSEGWLRSR